MKNVTEFPHLRKFCDARKKQIYGSFFKSILAPIINPPPDFCSTHLLGPPKFQI